MENEPLKEIVVIYHGGNCQDGFGSAYAAWKKFGEAASYIPLKTSEEMPAGLEGKELYILDYSFTKDVLEELRAQNQSVMVIDHHLTTKDDVTAFPENIHSTEHSAATMSWRYFHPDTEVPQLLLYIEDNDLWRFALPHNREFGAALGDYNMDFETWDTLNRNFQDKQVFDAFIRHGEIIAGFEDKLVRKILQFREKVQFEGHTCYAVNAERVYRSILGHELASISDSEGGAAIGIVYYRANGRINCSLRSNGDLNVAEIAERYGGGGHKNAASFNVQNFAELPFQFI